MFLTEKRALVTAILLTQIVLTPHPVAAQGVANSTGDAQGDTQRGAAKLYEKASIAVLNEQDAEAVIHLKNALQADSSHLPSRILLGETYLRNGDPATAEKELRWALDLGADPNLVLPPLGYSMLLMEDFDAIIDFQTPQVAFAAAKEWQIILGRAFLGANQPQEAYEVFDRLVNREPDNVVALLGKANARALAGNYIDAVDIADLILARDDTVSSAWKIKGDAARARGELDTGVNYYARALDVDPSNLAAKKERALALLQLGRYEDALEEVEQLRFEMPSDPQSQLINAWILARLKQDEQAGALLDDLSRRLATVDPSFIVGNAQVQLVQGLTLYLQGRIDEALPHLSGSLLRQPQNLGVRIILAQVAERRAQHERLVGLLRPIANDGLLDEPALLAAYVRALTRLDQYSEAVELLVSLHLAAPENVELTELLAGTYAYGGRIDDAVNLLIENREASSTRDGGIMLGYLLLEQNQLDAAIDVAEQALTRYPDDVNVIGLAGATFLKRGDLDKAEPLLQKALARTPVDLALRLNLAYLTLARGRSTEAKEAFRQINEEFGGSREALKALSDIAVAERDIEPAIQWTQALTKLEAEVPDHAFRLAGLELAAGRPDVALRQINQLERDYPLQEQLLDLKARAYLLSGEFDSAQRWLAYLASANADSPSKLAELAGLQIQARDAEGAQKSIQRLTELEPDNAKAILLRARLELATGLSAAALTRLRAFDEAHPNQVEVLDMLAEAAWRTQDLKSFRRYYEQAQTIDPTATRLLGVARRLWKAGQSGQSRQLLSEWLASHPDDMVVGERLAESLTGLNQPEAAYAQYQAMIESGAQLSPSAYSNMATIALSLEPQRARTLAEKAYELNPNDPAVIDTLGWILVQTGLPEEGLRHLREAYTRASQVPAVRYHLAVALHRLSRNEEARTLINELLGEEAQFEDREEALALLQQIDARS